MYINKEGRKAGKEKVRVCRSKENTKSTSPRAKRGVNAQACIHKSSVHFRMAGLEIP